MSEKAKSKADERIYLPKEQMLKIEAEIRLRRHIERYALLRQFAKGKVCDLACGCGYGSYLLSTNPDVELVIGLDKDQEAIDYALQEYKTNKTQFYQMDLETWKSPVQIDMLISVETIEHLKNPYILVEFLKKNNIKDVIITYPSKKTTHYNFYHYHDFQLSEIKHIFKDFQCNKYFNWEYEFDVVFFQKK